MKKLLMVTALVACASPALANSLVASSTLQIFAHYGYDNCRTTWTKIPDPVRDPEQERLDAIARRKEDAKWMEFCKPVFKPDDFGVRRATYARKGCEFGLNE